MDERHLTSLEKNKFLNLIEELEFIDLTFLQISVNLEIESYNKSEKVDDYMMSC